jgi:hypothetical protein
LSAEEAYQVESFDLMTTMNEIPPAAWEGPENGEAEESLHCIEKPRMVKEEA